MKKTICYSFIIAIYYIAKTLSPGQPNVHDNDKDSLCKISIYIQYYIPYAKNERTLRERYVAICFVLVQALRPGQQKTNVRSVNVTYDTYVRF